MANILLISQIIIVIFLVIIILFQGGSGDELSGLSGSTRSFSSEQSANTFLRRLTTILVALFMINSLIMARETAGKIKRYQIALESIVKKDSTNAPEIK